MFPSNRNRNERFIYQRRNYEEKVNTL